MDPGTEAEPDDTWMPSRDRRAEAEKEKAFPCPFLLFIRDGELAGNALKAQKDTAYFYAVPHPLSLVSP